MNASDEVKQAWQASPAHPPLPRLDEVREGAVLFYHRIRRRNRVEYAASLFVILFFGAAALLLEETTARIGAVLAVAGTMLVVWQLHSRASAVAPPEDAASPLIAHQRAQLVRQRDALASVGLWYLLPPVPGIVLVVFAGGFEHGAGAPLNLGWHHYVWIGFMTFIFAGIWWANRAAARTLQTEIDALDALGEER